MAVRALRIRALALLAFAFALMAAPPAPAAEKGLASDVTWGWSDDATQERTLQEIIASGSTWARLDADWGWIDANRADAYRQIDRAVNTLEAAGIKVVMEVLGSPQWASGSTNGWAPPKDPADYADFMTEIVTRYKGKVEAWEIWNEPNKDRFWPTGVDAAEYVALLKAAHPAVKAADPQALVTFGGLSTNDYAYLEAAYAAEPDLGDYFDVMVVHPYPHLAAAPGVQWSDLGSDRISKDAFTGYREVRATMLAQGDDKPIWMTEFGYATTTQLTWCGGVDAITQALYLTQAYEILEQDPYVEVAIWYLARNTSDANTWEDQLGLMRADFTPKPAWQAFKDYEPPAPPTPPAVDPPPNGEPAPPEEGPADPPVQPEPPAEPAVSEPPVALTSGGDQPEASRRPGDRLRLRVRRERVSASRARLVVRGKASAPFERVRVVVRRRSARRARVVQTRADGRFRVRMKVRTPGRWRVRAFAGGQRARVSVRLT